MPDKKPSKLLMGMMTRIDEPTATNPSEIPVPEPVAPTPVKNPNTNLNAWNIPLSEKANPEPPQSPSATPKYKPSNAWASQGPQEDRVPPEPDTSMDAKVEEVLAAADAREIATSKQRIHNRVERLNNIGKTLVKHAINRGVEKDSQFISAKASFDTFTKALEQKGGEALVNASPEQMKLLDKIQDTLLSFVNSDGKNYEKFLSQMRNMIGRTKALPGSAKTNDFLASLSQTAGQTSTPKPKSLFSIITDKYFGDIKQLKTGKDWFEEKSVIGQYLRRNEVQNREAAEISAGQLEQQQINLKAETGSRKTSSYKENAPISTKETILADPFMPEMSSNEGRVTPTSKTEASTPYKARSLPEVSSEMAREKAKAEGHYQEHVERKEKPSVMVKGKEEIGTKAITGVLGKILVELQDIKEALLLGEAGAAISGKDGTGIWDKAKNMFSKGSPAAAAGVGSTGMMLGTVGSVALGGALASYGATGIMASPIQEANRKALQENTMLGATSGDTAMASAILDANQGKAPEQVRAEQEKEKMQLKDAPWWTRIYGIGKTDYLKDQSNTMLNQAPEQLPVLNEAAKAQEKAPVVIQSPPPAAPAPQNNTQTVPVRASSRNNDSSFQDWVKHKMQGW